MKMTIHGGEWRGPDGAAAAFGFSLSPEALKPLREVLIQAARAGKDAAYARSVTRQLFRAHWAAAFQELAAERDNAQKGGQIHELEYGKFKREFSSAKIISEGPLALAMPSGWLACLAFIAVLLLGISLVLGSWGNAAQITLFVFDDWPRGLLFALPFLITGIGLKFLPHSRLPKWLWLPLIVLIGAFIYEFSQMFSPMMVAGSPVPGHGTSTDLRLLNFVQFGLEILFELVVFAVAFRFLGVERKPKESAAHQTLRDLTVAAHERREPWNARAASAQGELDRLEAAERFYQDLAEAFVSQYTQETSEYRARLTGLLALWEHNTTL